MPAADRGSSRIMTEKRPILPGMPVSAPSCEVQEPKGKAFLHEYPGRRENSWRVKDGALLSDISGASAGSVPFGRRAAAAWHGPHVAASGGRSRDPRHGGWRAAAANGFGRICLSGPGTRRRTPPPAQRRIVPDRRPCSVLKAPSLSRMARPAPAVPQASGQGSARSETRAWPVGGHGALVCAVFGASIHIMRARRNGRLKTCSRA